MKFYHNPRCSKSRQTLALLEENGHAVEIVKYLEDTPSIDELKSIVEKLGFSSAHQLFRTKETLYKELDVASSKGDETKLIEILNSNPKLIERPILVTDEKAAIGRPPESVLDIIA